MRKRKIERMTLVSFSLGAIRGRSAPPLLDGAPSMQPHFNPSVPYTVPQSPETPVSPGSPGSVFGPR
jgi:hypothetical protein